MQYFNLKFGWWANNKRRKENNPSVDFFFGLPFSVPSESEYYCTSWFSKAFAKPWSTTCLHYLKEILRAYMTWKRPSTEVRRCWTFLVWWFRNMRSVTGNEELPSFIFTRFVPEWCSERDFWYLTTSWWVWSTHLPPLGSCICTFIHIGWWCSCGCGKLSFQPSLTRTVFFLSLNSLKLFKAKISATKFKVFCPGTPIASICTFKGPGSH